MFLTGPKVVKEALGEEASAESLGGASVHERNGVCHFVAEDDAGEVEVALGCRHVRVSGLRHNRDRARACGGVVCDRRVPSPRLFVALQVRFVAFPISLPEW
jgi:hypothetical protein